MHPRSHVAVFFFFFSLLLLFSLSHWSVWICGRWMRRPRPLFSFFLSSPPNLTRLSLPQTPRFTAWSGVNDEMSMFMSSTSLSLFRLYLTWPLPFPFSFFPSILHTQTRATFRSSPFSPSASIIHFSRCSGHKEWRGLIDPSLYLSPSLCVDVCLCVFAKPRSLSSAQQHTNKITN